MKIPSQNFAHRYLKLFFVSSLFLSGELHTKNKDTINLKSILPNIEIADNFYARKRGLMYRSSLQANTGMLFIWEDYSTRGMWMKNTKVPLSIAFMSEDSVRKRDRTIFPSAPAILISFKETVET